ncbi:LapA family protein [Mycolicibacterium sp. CH28]|uniref:protein UsfY n=1 Tax=Mycolicibacterium sp. CH28 TaxID=2512237 RepID=UPI0010814F07|nr:protein UsfY [Mycolicibacterium sp. CH28]TGD84380.1 LapA family protein [Mycolicibacterium sp. CH28]
MKGAYRDPVDHARTTQPHAGESFIDTLWLPGLLLIALGVVGFAGTVAALAYNRHGLLIVLAAVVAGLLIVGGLAIMVEHHRVQRVERQWLSEHPDHWQNRHSV